MYIMDGNTDITSAGTAAQLSNTKDKVAYLRFYGEGGSGTVWVGSSTVDNSPARGIGVAVASVGAIGTAFEINFKELTGGTVRFDQIYGNADTNGNNVVWFALCE